uniref:Uncharacterized protein n=1 Tax=Prymnesium polylepis TaxID=72548 RepID=A0A7S4MQ23_9EUKA
MMRDRGLSLAAVLTAVSDLVQGSHAMYLIAGCAVALLVLSRLLRRYRPAITTSEDTHQLPFRDQQRLDVGFRRAAYRSAALAKLATPLLPIAESPELSRRGTPTVDEEQPEPATFQRPPKPWAECRQIRLPIEYGRRFIFHPHWSKCGAQQTRSKGGLHGDTTWRMSWDAITHHSLSAMAFR